MRGVFPLLDQMTMAGSNEGTDDDGDDDTTNGGRRNGVERGEKRKGDMLECEARRGEERRQMRRRGNEEMNRRCRRATGLSGRMEDRREEQQAKRLVGPCVGRGRGIGRRPGLADSGPP